jgi:tRNA/tmRNA/rRNA uracil-C5-methylase (TrmA/RlmC/RlmD family)
LYGGCRWLSLAYEDQLSIKNEQIHEAFFGLSTLAGQEGYVFHPKWHPIVPSPESEHYRNKVEFSWGKYISEKENIHDEYRF